MTTTRPFRFEQPLLDCRFDLLEAGVDIEYFHAAEDRQAVRDLVFAKIAEAKADLRIDSVIVEKCKTGPALREDTRFYPRMMGYLLRYVLSQPLHEPVQEVIVITDRIPVNKKRGAISKAVKQVLADMLPREVGYRVWHHDSKSCMGLQVADYCNWAIYRAWDRDDRRALHIIESAVLSQFDIFRLGTKRWY